jgi:hypothetical protein
LHYRFVGGTEPCYYGLENDPMDEQTLGDMMDSICVAAAEAVRRYAEIAAIDPIGDMPEHFISSMVFEKIGRKFAGKGIAFGLEISVKKLRAYNIAAKANLRINDILVPPPDPSEASTPSGYEKVDMAIFESDASNARRGLLALVEFKFGFGSPWLRDRDKLLRILREIDVCQWGIFCAVVGHDPNPEWLADEAKVAQQRADLWRIYPVGSLPATGRYHTHSICALGFKRPTAPVL